MTSFTPAKKVCRIEALLGSIIITGIMSIQTYAQPNSDSDKSFHATNSTSSKILYVNPGYGSDAPSAGISETTPLDTITYALQQASPGTIIKLASGSYSTQSGEVFPLVLKQGVILQGDESTRGENVTISGGGRYISPTFARQNVTVIAEKDSTISGVSISNPNKRGTALWIESANPMVKNNTFAQSNREGIFVTGKAAPVIVSNVFTKNGGNGISVANSATGEIRQNLFQDTGFGLAIGGTSKPRILENKIIQNRDGLFISEDARPMLRNNVIEKNVRDGIVIAACAQAQPDLGTAESFGGNVFNNNGQYDIHSSGANSLVMNGNQLDRSRVMEQHQYQCGI